MILFILYVTSNVNQNVDIIVLDFCLQKDYERCVYKSGYNYGVACCVCFYLCVLVVEFLDGGNIKSKRFLQ